GCKTQVLGTLGADLPQLLQRAVEIGALGLQVVDGAFDAGKQHTRLGDLRGVGIVELEVLRHLLQREAQVLAAQDQHQAGPVAARIGALGAPAHGGDQALGLIEADGPGRDLELGGKLPDAVEAIRVVRCRSARRREAPAARGWRPRAHLPLAFRRCSSSAFSSFLESLPMSVLGRASRNSISAGISILEILASRWRLISSTVALMPALSLMKALGASPR